MKIIQIAATETADANEVFGTLYALADDGSIWMMIGPWEDKAKWRKLPDVKGENPTKTMDYPPDHPAPGDLGSIPL